MTTSRKPATKPTARASTGLLDEEKAAIKERVKELKTASRRSKGEDREAGEREVLAKIALMPEPYRGLSERLHALITASAPVLVPKTWYGLPAYAKDGKIICYMRMNPKSPFNDRYLTFGFNESASLDEGAMWPVAFALDALTAAEEGKIAALIQKAVG